MRVKRDRHQVLADATIAARLIQSHLANGNKPTPKKLCEQLKRPKASVMRDLDIFCKESDDKDLVATVRTWQSSSNYGLTDEAKAAIVDLFIECRDTPTWGFPNEKYLCAALGVPVFTMRNWREEFKPDDWRPLEFKNKTDPEDWPDGLLVDAMKPTHLSFEQDQINGMRLDQLRERLDAIRALQD